MFGLCRYCGDELDRARRPLEVCARCEDSPLCDACGHPRADHTHVFAWNAPKGCNRVVGDFQSLRSWRCECEGFRPIRGSLAEATFAAPEDLPVPPLRVVRP